MFALKLTIRIGLIIGFAALATQLFGQTASSDSKTEEVIRKLDKALVDAILKSDIQTLDALFSKDYRVNAPNNRVTKKAEVLERVKNNLIYYSSFESQIESITVHGNTVIVMGNETVKPIGNALHAGQTVNRRYTQVWVKTKGKWLQIARHANVICDSSSNVRTDGQ